MKKLLAIAAAMVLLQTASMAQANDFSFSINVGGPPVVIAQPPSFLYPPELGYGVAVGVPYDMFYVSGIYYIYRGGGWYRTSRYGGDWVQVRHRELPPGLRRYKIGKIREYREREYRVYSQDRDHYRGRYYRPDHGERGRGEEHRDMRGQGQGGERHEQRGREGRDDHGGERRDR